MTQTTTQTHSPATTDERCNELADSAIYCAKRYLVWRPVSPMAAEDYAGRVEDYADRIIAIRSDELHAQQSAQLASWGVVNPKGRSQQVTP